MIGCLYGPIQRSHSGSPDNRRLQAPTNRLANLVLAFSLTSSVLIPSAQQNDARRAIPTWGEVCLLYVIDPRETDAAAAGCVARATYCDVGVFRVALSSERGSTGLFSDSSVILGARLRLRNRGRKHVCGTRLGTRVYVTAVKYLNAVKFNRLCGIGSRK